MQTAKDVKASFTIDMKDGDDISMNLWMKGEKDRKVFTALSPMTEGYSRKMTRHWSGMDRYLLLNV